MKPLVRWLLVSNKTSLSAKNMAAKIGSSAIDCSPHPYSMCMWTNSDHPSGGRMIYVYIDIGAAYFFDLNTSSNWHV